MPWKIDMDTRLDTPFWRFSLAVYARDGVAAACRSLQDRHQLDVNLLLLCVWAGHDGIALPRGEIARLSDRVADWRVSVVRPLRGVRQWLKQQAAAPADLAEDLRGSVKDIELAAERLQQAMLYGALPAGTDTPTGVPGPRLATANLSAYFGWLSREPGVADAADLAELLTAAFGETLRPLDAVWLLQDAGDALPA